MILRTKKKEKKLSGNFGYMVGSNHWGDIELLDWLVIFIGHLNVQGLM